MDPCSRCGRTLRQVVRGLSIDERRGREPFCSVPKCPLYNQLAGFLPARELKGDTVYGPSPPSLFVGRVGWPNVTAGPLVPPGEVENAGRLDDPTSWASLDLAEVLTLRSGLVRSKARIKVHDASSLQDPTGALVAAQELAMADKAAHTELTLNKAINVPLSPMLNGFAAPTGPSVTVKRAALTENTSVPRRVDAAVDDIHATASTVIEELYDHGTSPYHVQRILSVGLLGRQHARRFVPTRWSVTATDDIIGKNLIPRVRDRQPITETELRTSELHGNRFMVVLFPGPWRYEMAEAWRTGASRRIRVFAEHEDTGGRTSYADTITGAYYAARLSVLEHLAPRRRRATSIVLREITDDYYAPAGVWVIREGVAKAMQRAPERPDSDEAIFERIRQWAPHIDFLGRSKWLQDLRYQTRLDAFG